LAESAFGAALGAELNLDTLPENLSNEVLLFAESHSRFVVSIRPENKARFEQIMGNRVFHLGKVGGTQLSIARNNQNLIQAKVDAMQKAWSGGLSY
jgi:phosphoribosylformylglycinamidine synthase